MSTPEKVNIPKKKVS